MKESTNYVIKEGAAGGLAGAEGLSKEISKFHENDLIHKSTAMSICK